MVQTILAKGFQRVRYYGLQATCKLKKVRAILAGALQSMVQGAFAWLEQVVVKLSYQERMKRAYGLDPLVCEDCGAELWRWYVWHPDYGVIYDELDQLKAGQYELPPVAEPPADRNDPEPVVQRPLFDLPIPFVYV